MVKPGEMLRLAVSMTQPWSLRTWPIRPDLVTLGDMMGLFNSPETATTNDMVEHEIVARRLGISAMELEDIIEAGELFRDAESGTYFTLEQQRPAIWRACADSFYEFTWARFGSLTDFSSGEIPDWAIPMHGGQTVRVGHTYNRTKVRSKLLVGLDASGTPSWVLAS